MNYFALSIGTVATLIGLAITALTIVFLHENRVKNIVTGIGFVLFGAGIIWLTSQGNATFQINLGIPDKYTGLLLFGIVASLFILKGVLDIREGSKQLQAKTSSSFLVFKSKLKITIAVIITAWVIFLLVVAFTQFGR